jgi:hypothetical protein
VSLARLSQLNRFRGVTDRTAKLYAPDNVTHPAAGESCKLNPVENV